MVAYASAGETVSERAYRSNEYLIAAAAHGLDYFPDFERGATAGTLQKVYRSLPMQLYERVAHSLNDSLTGGDVVSEWSAISTIPIPPVAALVFDRATSLADVPDALLRVRTDFARYRKYSRASKPNWLKRTPSNSAPDFGRSTRYCWMKRADRTASPCR
jgi:hypothetical protein